MMPTADLVVLPYQSLLSKSSQDSLGLNLKNSVIIIDEAHNLTDIHTSMYDAKITLPQAFLKARCESQNIDSICDTEDIKSVSNTSVTVNEFLFALNIDNINFVKLLRYIKESHIIYKVSGYIEKVYISQQSATIGETEGVKEESAISGFRAPTDLLSSLTNKDSDVKIIVSIPQKTCNAQEGGYIKLLINLLLLYWLEELYNL